MSMDEHGCFPVDLLRHLLLDGWERNCNTSKDRNPQTLPIHDFLTGELRTLSSKVWVIQYKVLVRTFSLFFD